jgi:histidyl-tRNA synthetase
VHFDGVKGLLEEVGLEFTVNPRLVRGLDYYNRTVFEFVARGIGAQSTIAGGGRYDGLFEQLGGKPTPACGFGMGIDRALLALRSANVAATYSPHAFVAHSGDSAARMAWSVSERLRDAGLSVVLGAGGSFKSQMKKADASGARYAVILGDSEVQEKKVTLKPLRENGEQRTLALEEAIEHIR